MSHEPGNALDTPGDRHVETGPPSPPGLRLVDVFKRYGSKEVVQGVNLDVTQGEFVVFVGPSGCGKSTLLRMIAGLEPITEGTIEIAGIVVNDIPPRGRDIAMVFQDYALYPHMSVGENLGFGLKMRGVPKAEAEQRMKRAAEILQIDQLLDRRPRELSGGQRQRVAMGRAIVREPRVFLFDEPLSNLDAKLRAEMRTEIKRLHAQLHTTVVYVTHDQVEAMTLADRIVVLRGGKVEQVGMPDEIYSSPRSQFVAAFMGSPPMNLIGVQLREGSTLELAPGVNVPVPPRYLPATRSLANVPLTLGIRPEHILRRAEVAGSATAGLTCPVTMVEPLGSDTLVYMIMGAREIVARVAPTLAPRPGDRFRMEFDPANLHLFDAQQGYNLFAQIANNISGR